MTTTKDDLVPNHHAHHSGFSGVRGWIAGLTMLPGRGRTAHLAADLTGITAADHVVDVGSGPGTAVRYAARRGAHAIGVDPAPVMLRLARSLTRDDHAIAWAEGTAEALPLADGSATVLWSISTVHHWADVDLGVAEARRVLTSAGRFLTIERHTRPQARGLASHGWTDAQAAAFAAACRAAGFADVTVSRHQPGRTGLLVVQSTKP